MTTQFQSKKPDLLEKIPFQPYSSRSKIDVIQRAFIIMSNKTVFVIQNQAEQYLTKQKTWCSGKDNSIILKCDHHDEALNTLIEVNAKDILLRGLILDVELDEKKNPIVEISEDAIKLEEQGGLDHTSIDPLAHIDEDFDIPAFDDLPEKSTDDSPATASSEASVEQEEDEESADLVATAQNMTAEEEAEMSEEEIQATIAAMLEEQQKRLSDL